MTHETSARFRLVSLVVAFGLITACGGNVTFFDNGAVTPPSANGKWTWVGGGNTLESPGVYGLKGTPAAANIPGARNFPATCTDNAGNLWLFGGNGVDATGGTGLMNDLWKFNGSQWTWVSGDNTFGSTGSYGTINVAADSNVPRCRIGATSWIDNNGHFWLFGGQLPAGYLNDLWKFDGTRWTWVGGSNGTNQAGVYGTRGTTAAANQPGARFAAQGWVDNHGNLWLFGGFSVGSLPQLFNDLWKFDGTNWTWISGSNTPNQIGIYGAKGTPNAMNVPGGRMNAASWVDSGDRFWIFGGTRIDAIGTQNPLNDLWRFDGTNWTWMSGSSFPNQPGTYGVKGTPASGTVPGARFGGAAWTDRATGTLWLFGGSGNAASLLSNGVLNDLWKFAGNQWTWVAGNNTANGFGIYGAKGTPAAVNVPGGRVGTASWTDNAGNLNLFGGDGFAVSARGNLADLWRFRP